MKINYKKISAYLLTALFLILPILITANTTGTQSGGQGGSAASIKNPLGEGSTLYSLLEKIMDIVTVFGSLVVVFFIIFSGFKFVTARGNDSEISKAKEMFYATIIGAAILLGARVIAEIVVGTVQATTGLEIKRSS